MKHFVLTLLLLASPVFADSRMGAAPLANVQLTDVRQEQQAKALMETIRCLVCQGQSIADSDAEMAGDMRSLIRERIQKGERPEAIRTWLFQRYGDWVTYEPPLSMTTIFLWGLPLLLLMMGGGLAMGRIRRTSKR
jgi:cytochrome c-type biogenesis protein CcmH